MTVELRRNGGKYGFGAVGMGVGVGIGFGFGEEILRRIDRIERDRRRPVSTECRRRVLCLETKLKS